MERICQECRKHFGEKCFGCGSEEVIKIPHTEPQLYECPRCGRKWAQGEDPSTHGICDKCITGALARIDIPSVAEWHPRSAYGR